MEYNEIVYEYLDKNKNLNKLYTFDFFGRIFLGMNDVFAPSVFEDTHFFFQALPFKPNSKILEIGCGTGAISVSLALSGGFVTSTDVNKSALRNTQINALVHGVENYLNTILSNVFESIDSNSKYDTIFWNAPFIYTERQNLDLMEQSVFDAGYDGISRFVKESHQYLTSSGRVFLGFSSSSGKYNLLQQICSKENVELNLINKKFLDEDFSVELYELIKIA